MLIHSPIKDYGIGSTEPRVAVCGYEDHGAPEHWVNGRAEWFYDSLSDGETYCDACTLLALLGTGAHA